MDGGGAATGDLDGDQKIKNHPSHHEFVSSKQFRSIAYLETIKK